jgi:crotonobetainyl-CoA:carnitine CoA-transferase CaiB-like acyl-CoA transferase
MAGPLDGIRVVDLTAMITGPLATMILADQGAEVVKVEPPGIGDLMRVLGTQRGGMSGFFACCNRGKRSVVINLRDEAGRDLVRRLAAEADVFIQNFRPGVIERLGLDEAALRGDNPELVYVSISAFGPSGPYSHKPAYDHILQGISGLASLQGEPGSGTPQYVRNAVCDKTTALTVAQAVSSALFARASGRGGQHVRLSMLDAALSFVWPDGMANHTILEDDVVPMMELASLYRNVESDDGFLSVAALTDAQWAGLCRATERPELIDDPRFATAFARVQNFEALVVEAGDGRIEAPRDEALARLEAEDVPCGPVLAPHEVHEDPQVRATGALVESEHPVLGRMRQPRPAARFEVTPSEIRRPAPRLGEHTEEVLGEIGLSPTALGDLRGKGVVA